MFTCRSEGCQNSSKCLLACDCTLVQKSLPASWAKVRKVYKDRKWFRGRLDCFFFSSDSESLYASTREQHGVGWGSVAGLTENKTKPSSLGLAELGNLRCGFLCMPVLRVGCW